MGKIENLLYVVRDKLDCEEKNNPCPSVLRYISEW